MENYKDLGLPSGTLWAETNEDGFFRYDEALKKYGNQLPTKEDWYELIAETGHVLMEKDGVKGIRFTNKYGESIFLAAEGFLHCDGNVNLVGEDGYYWSSSDSDSERAMNLGFNSSGVKLNSNYRYYGFSVRLVKRKASNKTEMEDYKKKYEDALNSIRESFHYDDLSYSGIKENLKRLSQNSKRARMRR